MTKHQDQGSLDLRFFQLFYSQLTLLRVYRRLLLEVLRLLISPLILLHQIVFGLYLLLLGVS